MGFPWGQKVHSPFLKVTVQRTQKSAIQINQKEMFKKPEINANGPKTNANSQKQMQMNRFTIPLQF